MISTALFPPSAQFWSQCAQYLMHLPRQDNDFSDLQIIVPAFEHATLLTNALTQQLGCEVVPPRINTLSGWLALQALPPDAKKPIAHNERLMSLYAELREHGWLKQLFSARKNTDLLPLARTLITLSDELTEAWLPNVRHQGITQVEQIWHRALASFRVQNVLSNEAELVWKIWTSQMDANDPIVLRFQHMLFAARDWRGSLLWISPVEPEGLELEFLNTIAKKNSVHVIGIDWRSTAIPTVMSAAWREIVASDETTPMPNDRSTLDHVLTLSADTLEAEALYAAQTISDWIAQGKTNIALIAQDRVVARRIRALLDRAHIAVSDETGWKLSTTRAAAALAAWLDVVATRADRLMVLDFIKSPYVEPASMASAHDKSSWVMAIDMALRTMDASGGWAAMLYALKNTSEPTVPLIEQLHALATRHTGRKTLLEWLDLTHTVLDELGIRARWNDDLAGQQIVQLLDTLRAECAQLGTMFSFSEWRSLLRLQLENTVYQTDQRNAQVVMLPLNGARLRHFDAVLVAGCDEAHLPSTTNDTLFFSNAVRRECGLVTREQRQRQQLRDFAALLLFNPEVVLSWQRHQRGEDNPVSPWIERLNLALQRARGAPLNTRHVALTRHTLTPTPLTQPQPSAAALRPKALSASGYNSLLACPYQFFATRMLSLQSLDTPTDLPEKRDYGQWLHAILKTFHDTLKVQPTIHAADQQEALLRDISHTLFTDILKTNPAALGYSRRWSKVIPAYIAWSRQRLEAGWQFECGEVWLEKSLNWGRDSITLRGQIDRIDNNGAEYAVLDYKTNPLSVLKKRIGDMEDQQLPFYGLLADQAITSAHYVALEPTNKKLNDVDAPSYSDWQHQLKAAIVNHISAIANGTPLVAQGAKNVCRYCDVRGLCRKGAW